MIFNTINIEIYTNLLSNTWIQIIIAKTFTLWHLFMSYIVKFSCYVSVRLFKYLHCLETDKGNRQLIFSTEREIRSTHEEQ